MNFNSPNFCNSPDELFTQDFMDLLLDRDNCFKYIMEDLEPYDQFLNPFNPSPLRPMHEWENQEVVDFILNEISIESHEITNGNLQCFQNISGYIFRNLSEENCKQLSNSNSIGELIYNAKETYIRRQPIEYNQESNNYFYEVNNENSTVFNNINTNTECYSSPSKRPGRPKIKPNSVRMGKRSEKLWEFLLHLLRDSNTCPQLIKWENFEEGTFKFVQSDKVARLWGNRKKNDNMTYEKFSRAMRYYYKSKVLMPVPGKRLVYKFGPHAKGWKNILPIA